VLGSPRGGQFKDWLSAFDLSADGKTIVASDIAGLVHVWGADWRRETGDRSEEENLTFFIL